MENYVYIFESIKELYDVKKLPYPHTFMIDSHIEIEKAISRIFSTADHVLCIYYVNTNIQTKIRPEIRNQYDINDDFII
jgi:hypothetical protein